MNINKIVAIALALVFTLSLFAGCGSSTPVKEKDAGEITIFVDSTMKGALTAAATAYTKPVREKPEREKAIILINSASTEDIVKKLEDGEYADAVIVIGADQLDALDAVSGGKDIVIHSSRIEFTGEDGIPYDAAIVNSSDRQSVVQGFFDYLTSDEADAVLAEYGIEN